MAAAPKAKKKSAKKKTKKKIQAYAFIDTNIFLDFYRGSEATLAMLEKLEQVSDRIICTYQVEMEFLKNRQSEIARIVNQADLSLSASLPAVLADTQLSASLKSTRVDLGKTKTKLKNNLLKLLRSPKSDRVFNVLEKLFRSESEHVLTRDMKQEKNAVKRLARRRYQLGYPPRKRGDTSMGDAFNWEWVIHCAQKLSGRIIIVSRDSDYGTEYNKEFFLNDQLKKEFRERVGMKPLTYTQKLSEALDELEVRVTKAEKESEAEEIERISPLQVASRYRQAMDKYAQISEALANPYAHLSIPSVRFGEDFAKIQKELQKRENRLAQLYRDLQIREGEGEDD